MLKKEGWTEKEHLLWKSWTDRLQEKIRVFGLSLHKTGESADGEMWSICSGKEDLQHSILLAYAISWLVMKAEEHAMGIIPLSQPFETFPFSFQVGRTDVLFAQRQYKDFAGETPFVFYGSREVAISEEITERLGLSEVFYRLRFLPAYAKAYPWRFVLSADTIELYYEAGEEYFIADAGRVCATLEALLQAERLPVEWRIDPKPTADGFYIGMAMIPDFQAF